MEETNKSAQVVVEFAHSSTSPWTSEIWGWFLLAVGGFAFAGANKLATLEPARACSPQPETQEPPGRGDLLPACLVGSHTAIGQHQHESRLPSSKLQGVPTRHHSTTTSRNSKEREEKKLRSKQKFDFLNFFLKEK